MGVFWQGPGCRASSGATDAALARRHESTEAESAMKLLGHSQAHCGIVQLGVPDGATLQREHFGTDRVPRFGNCSHAQTTDRDDREEVGLASLASSGVSRGLWRASPMRRRISVLWSMSYMRI